MPQIILEHINKRFDKFVAVDDLNLVIEDRGFVTLLGPSGCGKTTTLRMIAGLETPTSGRILIDGKPVYDSEKGINLPPNKRDIGFLFQNYALWPHMTVYQNIAFGLEMLKWDKKRIQERVQEMLRLLKIEQFVKRYPAELSGGQQQRVAIARTLAPSPRVLFMDEPLSNLDAKLRGEMRTELKRLHTDTNSTFVYVTHDQLEAMTLSTRVCLMETGVLQQYAPPLEIYNRPANTFVAGFVGNPTMNFIPAKVLGRRQNGLMLIFLGREALFETADAGEVGEDAILGVRPEFLPISQNGALEAAIYSTLPAGMETTVKASCGDTMLTSVVFGSVDYEVDSKVRMDIVGSDIMLFDQATQQAAASGKIVFPAQQSLSSQERCRIHLRMRQHHKTLRLREKMDRPPDTGSKTQSDAPVAWVFFDIGSTLVDEEKAYAHRIRDMVRGTAVSFEQFAQKRVEFAKAGFDGDKKAIEYFGLIKTPWHSEDEAPFEDSGRTLSTLQSKGYRLGVIANQVPGAKARLDAWGLGEYFSVIASSAEVGLSKPDPGIFLQALEMANCRPENAVMVGDRLDNDIRPAKQLGMRTIRIRKGIAAFNEPSCEAETPDHTVETLSEILKYL